MPGLRWTNAALTAAMLLAAAGCGGGSDLPEPPGSSMHVLSFE